MKIYTKIVYDINDNIIEEESFEYNGPIAKADGGTMMLASSIFSAAKTYTDIQYAKAQHDAYKYQLHLDMEKTELDGMIEKNQIEEAGQKQKNNNLAYAVAQGYLDSSRHFLAVQDDQDRITNQDKKLVSLNTTYAVGVLKNKRYVDKLKTDNAVFGGYLSIAADVTGGYGKYKHYKEKPKKITTKPKNNFNWEEHEQDTGWG